MGSDPAYTVLASLDVFHSRPIAPTRRISLGRHFLPFSPAPGLGGVLLAGLLAQSAPQVAPELRADLVDIIEAIGDGKPIVQPRARHRLQTDTVGLTLSPQRLLVSNGSARFDFEDRHAAPLQLALAAIYAAGLAPEPHRGSIKNAMLASLLWDGEVGGSFISSMLDGKISALRNLGQWADPIGWAIDILELDVDRGDHPLPHYSHSTVKTQFRALLRQAHPDHGGHDGQAGKRISDLTEARRILLAK